MGIFSSKYKTTVATVAQRAVPDEAEPNSIRTGLLKALFSDEKDPDIPAYIMEELVGSVGVRAERMFDYASKHYAHGLPSGQFVSATQGTEVVEAVLTAQEGQPIEIEYAHIGAPNNLHVGWMRLISEQGYDPSTNKITAMGPEVYLYDMEVVIPEAMMGATEAGELDQWGQAPRGGTTPERRGGAPTAYFLPHSPVIVTPETVDEHVRVTFMYRAAAPSGWVQGNGGYMDIAGQFWITGTFNIPTGLTYDPAGDYFHVKYKVAGITRYVMLRLGTGQYPSLDQLYYAPAQELNGTFFPFAYFRLNKTSQVVNQDTDQFRTSRKMLKYLGIDYESMGQSINDNPDITDVEQAILMMAVPANSQHPLEQRYLFEFFENLASTKSFGSSGAMNITRFQNTVDNPSAQAIVIQDRTFKMALSNDGVIKRRVPGSIGGVGAYASGVDDVTTYQTMTSTTGGGDAGDMVTYTYEVPIVGKEHWYRKQISSVMYEEVRVTGLKMTYFVYGEYTTTADELDDILLIPLDRSVTEHFSIPDREVLFTRSLHYIFNSRVVTKIKWYQRSGFKFLLAAAAIVIVVVTAGQGYVALSAAVAAGTITVQAAIYALVIGALKFLAVGVALRLFVKVVGVEAAFVIAIIAAAAGYTQFLTTPGATSVAGAPWASELLQLSTGLHKGIEAVLADNMNDLIGEYSAFQAEVKEQTKLLDAAEDLLKNDNLLSPLVIFGESPDDYFNRTVHSGNIGVVGISAISSYVDNALRLPKMADSIEE